MPDTSSHVVQILGASKGRLSLAKVHPTQNHKGKAKRFAVITLFVLVIIGVYVLLRGHWSSTNSGDGSSSTTQGGWLFTNLMNPPVSGSGSDASVSTLVDDEASRGTGVAVSDEKQVEQSNGDVIIKGDGKLDDRINAVGLSVSDEKDSNPGLDMDSTEQLTQQLLEQQAQLLQLLREKLKKQQEDKEEKEGQHEDDQQEERVDEILAQYIDQHSQQSPQEGVRKSDDYLQSHEQQNDNDNKQYKYSQLNSEGQYKSLQEHHQEESQGQQSQREQHGNEPSTNYNERQQYRLQKEPTYRPPEHAQNLPIHTKDELENLNSRQETTDRQGKVQLNELDPTGQSKVQGHTQKSATPLHQQEAARQSSNKARVLPQIPPHLLPSEVHEGKSKATYERVEVPTQTGRNKAKSFGGDSDLHEQIKSRVGPARRPPIPRVSSKVRQRKLDVLKHAMFKQKEREESRKAKLERVRALQAAIQKAKAS